MELGNPQGSDFLFPTCISEMGRERGREKEMGEGGGERGGGRVMAVVVGRRDKRLEEARMTDSSFSVLPGMVWQQSILIN